MPVAPNINIKIHPPSSCADTGSDSILLRQTDAVAAALDIQPTQHPLHVRFPDGQTAQSIGITTVAIPSTNIPLPAHIFTDASLRQSLFGIADITNLDYDATFRKDGLYLYKDTELVHLPPSHSTRHPGLFPSNAHSHTLTLSSPCPPTRNLYTLVMPHWAAHLYLHCYVHYVKGIYLRYLDLLLPCSASTRLTLKPPQWAI
jgi:hypothetical protein